MSRGPVSCSSPWIRRWRSGAVSTARPAAPSSCWNGGSVPATGCWILSIAAARLGASRVTGIELDPEALPVSVENAARNGVAGVVRFVEGDAAAMARLLAPADLVVSNILRLVNQALLPSIHDSLSAGGRAIFSGMETGEAEAFRGPLAEAGFTGLDEVVDEGWWSVAARRA